MSEAIKIDNFNSSLQITDCVFILCDQRAEPFVDVHENGLRLDKLFVTDVYYSRYLSPVMTFIKKVEEIEEAVDDVFLSLRELYRVVKGK